MTRLPWSGFITFERLHVDDGVQYSWDLRYDARTYTPTQFMRIVQRHCTISLHVQDDEVADTTTPREHFLDVNYARLTARFLRHALEQIGLRRRIHQIRECGTHQARTVDCND